MLVCALNMHRKVPGLLAVPAPPPPPTPIPRHWLARGSSQELGDKFPLSKRSERTEYEGTKNYGDESVDCKGRRPVGAALGAGLAQERRCLRSRSLKTPTKPEGELPQGVVGAGSSAPANRCPEERRASQHPCARTTPRLPPDWIYFYYKD